MAFPFTRLHFREHITLNAQLAYDAFTIQFEVDQDQCRTELGYQQSQDEYDSCSYPHATKILITARIPTDFAHSLYQHCAWVFLTTMPNSTGRFQVLHSSAGAGKTHTLVSQYLLRCLEGNPTSSFKRVLALTFTNKAAGEMIDRVIAYLKEIGDGTDTRNASGAVKDVIAFLCSGLNCSEDDLKQRVSVLLSAVLYDRSSVAISTIDAFTKKVAQPFARDLHIDHDFEMTTETDYYGALAVSELLDSLEAGSDEEKLIIHACLQAIEDEDKWDLRQPLTRIIQRLDDETTARMLRSYREVSPEEIIRIKQDLSKRVKDFRTDVWELGKQVTALVENSGIPIEDFSGKMVPKFGKALSAYNGSNWPASKSVNNQITSGSVIPKSKQGPYDAEDSALVESLAPLFQHFQELSLQRTRREFIPRAIRANLIKVAVLSMLERELEKIKSEDGVLYFNDLTRKISDIIQSEPTPFIYERIGERYRHILIDEFQDTSVLQWHNLIPLAENALSNGGSVLLVGDAKQAIYRFRNGEVRQFTLLPRIFQKESIPLGKEREQALEAHFLKPEPLNRNFRSASSIVEFNNRLFSAAKSILSETTGAVFDEHEQAITSDRQGYVELIRVSSDGVSKVTELRELSMDLVIERISELYQLGYKPSDITLLVRSNARIQEASRKLIDAGMRVASSKSFQLDSDPVIRIMVDLLRYMTDKQDSYAAKIHYGLRSTGLCTEFLNENRDGLADVHETARKLIGEFEALRAGTSLYELISAMIDAMGLSRTANPMFLAFLQCVQEHGQFGDAGIASFIEHWDRNYHKKNVALAVDPEAVNIETMHKSKGLDFPIVIIPFADLHTGVNKSDPVWIAAEDHGLENALVNVNKDLKGEGILEIDEEEELKKLDDLNLLYVSLTRAKERMYIFTFEKMASPASLQLNAFIEEFGDGERFTLGDPSEHAEEQAQKEEQVAELIDLSGNVPHDVLFRTDAPEEWTASEPDPFRRSGNEIHEIFENLRDTNDLQKTLALAQIRYQLPEDTKTAIEKLFDDPKIASFFEPGKEAYNEAAILLDDGSEIRPDRIVIDGNTAQVLDLKTGMPKESHKQQVRKYMHGLRKLGYTEVTGHLLYLKNGELVSV